MELDGKASTRGLGAVLIDEERARLAEIGRRRALVCALAVGTGLRRGELARLRWSDVLLDARGVVVPAESAKNGHTQDVPLRADVERRLSAERALRRAEPESATIVPPRSFPRMRALRDDLAPAKIPYVDDRGLVADFQVLRTSLATALSTGGAARSMAQRIMRHSDPRLTAGTYFQPAISDIHRAVDSADLPNLEFENP